MDDPACILGSDLSEPLRFGCPRCGHQQVDDYEVIDPGVATEWRCGQCKRPFAVLLTECERCAAESVTVALALVEMVAPSAPPDCVSPHRWCLRHDEDEAQHAAA